jgi:hypothetical protein
VDGLLRISAQCCRGRLGEWLDLTGSSHTVFRTQKFTRNFKQQDEFYNAVRDNMGKKELLVPPDASDAKKRKVA